MLMNNYKIIKDFIINNLEYNAYYENLKHIYDFADDKTQVVDDIITCFNNYDCYYSIYTIMDSLEEFINDNPIYDTLEQYMYNEEFCIKERF
jgi:hypothetical protein